MLGIAIFLLSACTQEQQNKISRDIQNWTGTNGVLELYAGDKLVRRFLKIDKISTALGTDDGKPRAYRYGYGVLDENLNMQVDPGEKKVYFEISDYSNTVFFEESTLNRCGFATANSGYLASSRVKARHSPANQAAQPA